MPTFVGMREIVQKEAYEIAMLHPYCTLDIVMRLGKTLIGLNVAKEFRKVLVLYPNNSILKSWKDDAEKFDIDVSHITFSTYRSLEKHVLSDYSLVILDEIQLCSLANWDYISENIPERVLGLSGTIPLRGDKRYYINKICPVRYVKKLEETVGIVNKDYEIKIHLLQPSSVNNIPLGKQGKMWSERAKINFWDRKYNETRAFMSMLQVIQAIQNSNTKIEYAKKLADSLDRVLIFVETIEQCKLFDCPAYHSKEKESEQNLEKFKTGEINKLVTVRQLAAGVTIPVNNVIITHCYSSNDKAAQRIARALNFVEGEKANINILTLDKTRDLTWTQSGIEAFDKSKITYEK